MKTVESTTESSAELVSIEDKTSNYAAVRYNAMKHGVLSKHVVLPHEDINEFGELLASLMAEHKPNGPTESLLAEELAGIMWRKRRVLQAEGATINRNLYSKVNASYSNLASAAVPFRQGLPNKPTDIQELIVATPEEIAQRQEETRLDLECTEKANAILRKGGTSAYSKALKILLPDSRDWWEEYIEEGEYQPNAEDLAEFINGHLLPLCMNMALEALYHNEIKAQTIGEGMPDNLFEKLSRYETHLDRKFERTLAMLIKLKELRRDK